MCHLNRQRLLKKTKKALSLSDNDKRILTIAFDNFFRFRACEPVLEPAVCERRNLSPDRSGHLHVHLYQRFPW